MSKKKYYIVSEDALPDIFIKVAEAKRMLQVGEAQTVGEAARRMNISRSAFYKYKDDIFPFHDNVRGKTVTMVVQLDDEPGLLSIVLKTIAEYHANILTIHQSIPVNGIASLTLSVDVLPETGDVAAMTRTMEEHEGIHYLKILARE